MDPEKTSCLVEKNRPFGGFGDLIVLTYTELGNSGSRCKAQEPILWEDIGKC